MATKFLSLPDELISTIIQAAAATEQSVGGYQSPEAFPFRTFMALSLVCRRIGRLAQACLHVDIQVRSAVGFAFLANTLQARRDLRCRVKRLHIQYCARLDGRDAWGRTAVDAQVHAYSGARTSSSADLAMYECAQRGLLSAPLDALKELSLSAMPRALLLEALAQAGAAGIVPRLCKLKLASSDELDRARVWKLVAAFSRLTEIAFVSPTLPFPAMQAYPASLSSVRSLSLRSTYYEPTVLEPCMTPLASLFPDLTVLQLSGSWDRSHLERLLAATSRSLEKLDLPEATDVIDLSSVLTLFPDLVELRSTGTIALQDATSRLLTSRVQTLAFSGDAQVSLDTVADLVVRSRNRTLANIHLDLVPDNIPFSSASEVLGLAYTDVTVEDVATLAQQMRHLREPQWTRDVNPVSLTRLLNAAEAAGVRLTGRTVTLLSWEGEFEAELEQLLVAQAARKDDYSVLVAHYGCERAIDVVWRHRPGQAQLWMPHW